VVAADNSLNDEACPLKRLDCTPTIDSRNRPPPI
jgi:hypothetical protein